jgi:hypothetical protein
VEVAVVGVHLELFQLPDQMLVVQAAKQLR